MALSHIVATLTAKRNEIEAHIRMLREQLAMAQRDLSSVTAVLSLYELSPATQTRFPAYAHLNRLFVYGEMLKLAREVIAEAGKPLTTREIAAAIVHMKRWDEQDIALRKAITYRLIQSLGKAAKQGRIGDVGKRKGVRVWTTAITQRSPENEP